MLPALEGNQCSGRNLLVPNTGKKICFLFDSYSWAGFSHFRVLSWLTVQPDQRQRWLKSSDGGSDGDIESRGGADPCSVAAKCSFLFLVTVTSSLPSSKFLVTRWSPRSLSTQTMLGFCDPRAVSKPSPNKNISHCRGWVSDGCYSLSIMISAAERPSQTEDLGSFLVCIISGEISEQTVWGG